MGASGRTLVLLALCGCGSSSTVEVVGNQRPEPGTCELVQIDTHDVIDQGVFDLSVGELPSYVMTPLVRNRGGVALEVENVHVEIYEEKPDGTGRVAIRCDGGVFCDEWDLSPCDGGSCPTVPARRTGSFELPILPRLVTGYYQLEVDFAIEEGRSPPQFQLLVVGVLEGTAGGRPVVSPEFEYRVRLCLGCLVEFPPGSDAPSLPLEDCCGAGEPLPACYPGQDDPVDCRRCRTTVPEICNFGRLSCG